MAAMAVVLSSTAPLAVAQEPAAAADVWAPFRYFVGSWKGACPPADGKTFVFVSEAIENIPAGFKARLTYRILDADSFEQTSTSPRPTGNSPATARAS